MGKIRNICEEREKPVPAPQVRVLCLLSILNYASLNPSFYKATPCCVSVFVGCELSTLYDLSGPDGSIYMRDSDRVYMTIILTMWRCFSHSRNYHDR